MSTQSKWGTWNSIPSDFIEAMPTPPLQEQCQKSQKNQTISSLLLNVSFRFSEHEGCVTALL